MLQQPVLIIDTEGTSRQTSSINNLNDHILCLSSAIHPGYVPPEDYRVCMKDVISMWRETKVCECVCVCVCMCVYACACVCGCVHLHACACAFVCLCVSVCKFRDSVVLSKYDLSSQTVVKTVNTSLLLCTLLPL